MNKQTALIFNVMLSCLPMIAADNAIVVQQNQHESKVHQVLKSKKFWGAVAGVGLIASGGGIIWLINKLLIAKKIEDTSMDIMNSIEQNRAVIQQYSIKAFHGKKIIKQICHGQLNSKQYVVDDIRLFAKRGSYKIEIFLYSDLEHASPESFMPKVQLINSIKSKYETDFTNAINSDIVDLRPSAMDYLDEQFEE